ncbi:tRNA1(Val) (adenine(37)-N6)-methyltransferase [Devosia salina]|uniref:Methyltransferase n=1 Tax=Devosia salina TaxID=2860336 RepID=A0ABX8WFY8_9HYPH|nr:methyltransferase [Devosia salina]QYO77592.1 methyltransferase [Devosia salina]
MTRDAFLGGRLTLSQPRNGFRAGLDSVLLGAAVPAGTGRLLDMGAGVGTAGLVALALERATGADLAERDAATLDLAARNIAENGFAGRAVALAADVEAKAVQRRAAGLADNTYDVVIANPPFFGSGQGTPAPEASRAAARHMGPEALDLWVRCAAACARAGGMAIFIYPAQGLAALLARFEPRFGAMVVLPLSPRPGEPASRILLRGTKGSRAPLTLLASRAMHGPTGNDFAPEFDAVFRGAAALDW